MNLKHLKKYLNNFSIILILDVLHNEVKSINFKSIPSVYLYFAKDKSYPFQYDGQIQYDDLVKWVQYLIKLDKEK